MAYLRHFTGFLALILAIGVVQVSQPDIQVKGASDDFRQASSVNSKNSKKLKKSSENQEALYSRKLEEIGIHLRPGTDHRSDSKTTPTLSKRCRSLVYQSLTKLPESHRKGLKELTLFYTSDGRRGLSGSGAVIVRCKNVSDAELVSVFIHEMGHIVDATYLTSNGTLAPSNFLDFGMPVAADDLSAKFYDISWEMETERDSEATQLDFVSLYAMSDPFEDFAETYTYYRLHGPEFRRLKETSEMLEEKYSFMQDFVFGGVEFGLDEKTNVNFWKRNYDVTILPFKLKKFLG